MNPKGVAAAWNRGLGDMTALLDIIAARIANIKALQQSYADFRTQMATDAGPQFATDPTAWLTENQSKIDAVTATIFDWFSVSHAVGSVANCGPASVAICVRKSA